MLVGESWVVYGNTQSLYSAVVQASQLNPETLWNPQLRYHRSSMHIVVSGSSHALFVRGSWNACSCNVKLFIGPFAKSNSNQWTQSTTADGIIGEESAWRSKQHGCDHRDPMKGSGYVCSIEESLFCGLVWFTNIAVISRYIRVVVLLWRWRYYYMIVDTTIVLYVFCEKLWFLLNTYANIVVSISRKMDARDKCAWTGCLWSNLPSGSTWTDVSP